VSQDVAQVLTDARLAIDENASLCTTREGFDAKRAAASE
jgi:hypothetical protein